MATGVGRDWTSRSTTYRRRRPAMSKKSAYGRRRQEKLTTYQFSARTWNYVRAQIGWPETGEPGPYAACLHCREQLEATGGAGGAPHAAGHGVRGVASELPTGPADGNDVSLGLACTSAGETYSKFSARCGCRAGPGVSAAWSTTLPCHPS